jgi:hypothetical protein
MTPEEEYYLKTKKDLLNERLKLNQRLRPFMRMYPRMLTGAFYRSCAYTHNELKLQLPEDFPTHLRVADTYQTCMFYSNLSRSVLLFKSGHTSELLHVPNRPILLFEIKSELDELTLMEHRLELLKYLNHILRDTQLDIELHNTTHMCKKIDIQQITREFRLQFEKIDKEIKQLNEALKTHTHSRRSKE